MNTSQLHIFTDGGARGNPGPAAIGVVVIDDSGQTVKEIAKTIGYATNNVAEYLAVIEALSWLCQCYGKESKSSRPLVTFYLDSNLVVNQLNGLFKVKEATLSERIVEIRSLEQQLDSVIHYHYIPRRQNQRADELVNRALDEANRS